MKAIMPCFLLCEVNPKVFVQTLGFTSNNGALKEMYKEIESGVVSTCNKIENGVVNTYKKIEKKFVDKFLEEVPEEE